MNASPTTSAKRAQTRLAIFVGAAVLVAAVSAIALASRPTQAGPVTGDRPSASPTAASTAKPSATATARPTAKPTAKPTARPTAVPATPAPSGPPTIELANASGHNVVAQIIDQLGSVESVVSGTPGDGMSVRWHDAILENVDARTLRLTWVALPQDDQLGIGFAIADGHEQITIVQAGPPPNSDALGEDRVVLVTFDHAVDADDFVVEVLDETID